MFKLVSNVVICPVSQLNECRTTRRSSSQETTYGYAIFLGFKPKLWLFLRDVCANAMLIRWRRFLSPELSKNPTEGFSAGLIDDDNLFKWELMVVGPPDTF